MMQDLLLTMFNKTNKARTKRWYVRSITVSVTILFVCHAAYATKLRESSYDVNDNDTTKIEIGEKVPEFELKNVLNYKSTTLKLSDFKGKAVILDFWATWCSPCLKMMPSLGAFQKKFANDLAIISISYEGPGKVKSFFEKAPEKYRIGLITATENDSIPDNVFLVNYFPHRFLPHYVWIGKDNKLKAITGHENITESNVRKLINNEPLNLSVKKDIVSGSSDRSVPDSSNSWIKEILHNGSSVHRNGDIRSLKYLSMLSGYIKGEVSRFSGRSYLNTIYEDRRITAYNNIWATLFRMAYGQQFIGNNFYCPSNRIIYDIGDTIRYSYKNEDFKDTTKLYCYDVIIPAPNRDLLFKTMQEDLKTYFGVNARMEKRMTNCVELIVVDSTRLKTAGGTPSYEYGQLWIKMSNKPLSVLVNLLAFFNMNSGGKYNEIPVFLDKTNWNGGNVDINITAKLTDYSALRKELNKFGLDLVPVKRPLDILILTDK